MDRKEWLLGLHRQMVLIREFEDRVKFLFLEGTMPGTIHQYQGQEACAVGVCAALRADDVITSTHRPHGHALAKGSPSDDDGRAVRQDDRLLQGQGRLHAHGRPAKGMVPAVAIVGGGIPIATGMGLAFKMREEERVAVGFMGDGATNEGAFHEALNMAAHLGPARAVRRGEQPLRRLDARVEGHEGRAHRRARRPPTACRATTVDGNDVLAVYEAAREAVERARAGKGRRCSSW